ncbi:MAG: type II toxin-antitoxin system RatA family toxin [Burkholderiaceae bacterium]
MKTVNKSVLIWYSAAQMFDLVTDVPLYPQFLPWCDSARLVESSSAGALAEVSIHFAGIRQSFSTQNTHGWEPTGLRTVQMKLVKGPFSQLHGVWQFIPLGTPEQHASRVELQLHYGFDNAALGALVGPVFDKIASSMVDAFVKRAQAVYGG